MPSEAVRIPRSIYLDTNILMQLPYWDSNVNFIELREAAKLIHVPLFVPEVVAQELIQRRIETTYEQMGKMKGLSSTLGNLLGRDPLGYEQVNDIENRITTIANDFLNHIGLQVIPTPTNIPIETLVSMAIRREPPFRGIGEKGERGDRGFKDTIILFTIIEHMRSKGFQDAVFLSVDKIYSDQAVQKRLKDEGLNIFSAKSFTEATLFINQNIDSLTKKIIAEKSKQIKEFLSSKFDEIAEYIIHNVEISEEFLKPRGLWALMIQDHSLDGVSIKKILRVTPKGISRALPGFLLADEPRISGAEAVTFSVSLQFDLVVEEYRFGILPHTSEKFPISEPEAFEKIKLQPTIRDIPQKELTVFREITISAYIFLEDGRYSKLKISKAYT
ncbi:MAG: hypothetical protein A2Y65_03840 [Deltaproteobacteria bacterium RBG_13_52_11]|nr:MAG: hypothetical protein A2Y65_03840 [Deltaproteobacteria bacterium RBG_13_52_11]